MTFALALGGFSIGLAVAAEQAERIQQRRDKLFAHHGAMRPMRQRNPRESNLP